LGATNVYDESRNRNLNVGATAAQAANILQSEWDPLQPGSVIQPNDVIVYYNGRSLIHAQLITSAPLGLTLSQNRSDIADNPGILASARHGGGGVIVPSTTIQQELNWSGINFSFTSLEVFQLKCPAQAN
jgi:hypothetical protein